MRARCIIFGSKLQKQQSLTVIIVKHLNSLTAEGQFQLGSGVMKKNYFLTCFFLFFSFFFICRIFFSASIFYFSQPREIYGQISFFVFLIFKRKTTRKTANKGQKMTFFCSDCKYVQKLIK